MGGCCCRPSKNVESNKGPVYLYCPQNIEENEPSSGGNDVTSPDIFVDANLDTSTPDTYRSPPYPLPYNVVIPCSQPLPRDVAFCGAKDYLGQTTTDPQLGQGNLESSNISVVPDKPDLTSKPHLDYDLEKFKEDDVQKRSTSYEEDVCPICLEEYDSENPSIVTQCEHEFHLSCILEWMERSDTCPICDQIMVIDNTIGV